MIQVHSRYAAVAGHTVFYREAGKPVVSPAVQLRLFRDYLSNVELYPRVQQYFRDSQVPLLAAWGRNDEIFAPAGAEAFRRDLPQAEIRLLDGGHFLLESELEPVAWLTRQFLATLRP